MVACGGGLAKCKISFGELSKVVDKTEVAGVRCCSENEFSIRSRKIDKHGCTVFAGSKVGPRPKQCYNESTFAEAETLCTAAGARLCTKDELLGRCAKIGCRHLNGEMIWTSTPAAP